MLLFTVVCRMYDTHKLKMIGRILKGIRVKKKVDEIFRGKNVENKNCRNFSNISTI